MPPVSQSPTKNLEVENGTLCSNISSYQMNTHLVDLSENNLQELPLDVLELKKLRVIILNDNNLKNADIFKTVFPMLKKIDLNRNHLGSFPKPACLSKLRELILSNNLLNEFPCWLLQDKWYFLERLDLSCNPLFKSIESVEMPSQSHKMRNILDLNLSDTKMSIRHLPLLRYFLTLKKLDLSSYGSKYCNSIFDIPHETFPPDLEVLIMRNVGLNKYPSLYLHSLVILDLSNNSLSYIPEYSTINTLKKLILRNCTLYIVPNNLGCFESLVYLDLSYNKLSDLPETISECTNLKYLDIYDNSFTSYPEQLNKLNLEKLDLSFNYHDLPDMCGQKKYSEMESELRKMNNFIRNTGPKVCTNDKDDDYERYSSSSSEDFYSETDSQPFIETAMDDTVEEMEEMWGESETLLIDDSFDPHFLQQYNIKDGKGKTNEDELKECVEDCPCEIMSSQFFYLPARTSVPKSLYAAFYKGKLLDVPVVRTFKVEQGQFDSV